ncbi:hydroxyphenylacetyl-CoA thioesterase PaaI [Planctomonas sp. JC2975]|uniref:hydroxyphenylacetyl-CoA thioesterase PaaI n=1 Tax=Planctomonas sp. JC2975 TaxID=2729626 RepID=UPI00147332CA|nr:hydroxyphenylacetyl-CoA thioesterase PaaI [Planctomonas sp. JC2975]NNC10549.1 hydroxyphenylacetyl-CoA thioesterase PaaI [Planctomonas sp. JC2975]
MTSRLDGAREGHRAMMQRDRASAALGMVVERDEPGTAVVSMVVREDMTNGFAITHGGLVFALADTAFALACNEDERVTVAAGADIAFLKATHAGQTLTASAVRRVVAGRGGLYDVTVTDETGDVVAELRGRSLTTDRTSADASATAESLGRRPAS